MSNLEDIRDAARAQVHGQFAIEAVVYPDGLDYKDMGALNIRLHRDFMRPFGDLDREGYTMSLEGVTQVIIDVQDWRPKRYAVLDFGRGRRFRIENFPRDLDSNRYAICEVSALE